MASVRKYEPRRPVKGPDGQQLRDSATGKGIWEKTGKLVWRAQYTGPDGKQHTHHAATKRAAEQWLEQQSTKIHTGSWVAPKAAGTTVDEWAVVWLEAYRTRKPSTVRQAEVHLAKIRAAFGTRRLDSIRPTEVRAWLVKLALEHEPSYVYALHRRLGQLYTDAIHDGLVSKSPVSRRTAPKQGGQRAYVATTDQVWALYEAMGERYRPAVLLAAFAGLRLGEVCGLRVSDVDFMRGVIHPRVQYPADELKSAMSMTPVPIPDDLALELSRHVQRYPTDWVMSNAWGHQLGPWQVQRHFREARATVEGLPDEFRFHDLRHYFASLLIASGCDVKVVQARVRHASAKTTLDTYGHLWPDSDETTRAAIGSAMTARVRPTGTLG